MEMGMSMLRRGRIAWCRQGIEVEGVVPFSLRGHGWFGTCNRVVRSPLDASVLKTYMIICPYLSGKREPMLVTSKSVGKRKLRSPSHRSKTWS